jgi:hypothetical protein
VKRPQPCQRIPSAKEARSHQRLCWLHCPHGCKDSAEPPLVGRKGARHAACVRVSQASTAFSGGWIARLVPADQHRAGLPGSMLNWFPPINVAAAGKIAQAGQVCYPCSLGVLKGSLNLAQRHPQVTCQTFAYATHLDHPSLAVGYDSAVTILLSITSAALRTGKTCVSNRQQGM